MQKSDEIIHSLLNLVLSNIKNIMPYTSISDKSLSQVSELLEYWDTDYQSCFLYTFVEYCSKNTDYSFQHILSEDNAEDITKTIKHLYPNKFPHDIFNLSVLVYICMDICQTKADFSKDDSQEYITIIYVEKYKHLFIEKEFPEDHEIKDIFDFIRFLLKKWHQDLVLIENYLKILNTLIKYPKHNCDEYDG